MDVRLDGILETFPVTVASLPLPAGAATNAAQLADGHNVVVTSAPTTAITAAALPLPSGAATAANQLAAGHTVDLLALSSVGNGLKTVSSAGTAEVLGSSTTIRSVTIKALATNTGLTYVGDASVAAANGFQLAAGETVSVDIDNLTDIFLDVATSSEGVTYIYAV